MSIPRQRDFFPISKIAKNTSMNFLLFSTEKTYDFDGSHYTYEYIWRKLVCPIMRSEKESFYIRFPLLRASKAFTKNSIHFTDERLAVVC